MAKNMPIVTQLLIEASNQNILVATLLRKAKIIATKLNLPDFLKWIDNELNGYDCPAEELPKYRQLQGAPKAFNPYHGWQSIIFPNPEMEELFSSAPCGQSIGPLEEMLRDANNSSGAFEFASSPEAKQILIKSLNHPTDVQLRISKGALIGVLDAVRNAILEWSLELDNAGIRGEELMFSESEKEEAQPVTQHIFAQNIGQIGNLYDKAQVVNKQTAFATYDSKQITALIEEIEKTIEFLPGDTKEPIRAHIQEIKSEIVKPDAQQDRSRVSGALHSIKSVCEGAMGNVVAQGIISLIHNLPIS